MANKIERQNNNARAEALNIAGKRAMTVSRRSFVKGVFAATASAVSPLSISSAGLLDQVRVGYYYDSDLVADAVSRGKVLSYQKSLEEVARNEEWEDAN